MFGLRMPELLLILLVLVLLFGANKLPQLGQGLGETVKSFRKALAAGKDDDASTKAEAEAGASKEKERAAK